MLPSDYKCEFVLYPLCSRKSKISILHLNPSIVTSLKFLTLLLFYDWCNRESNRKFFFFFFDKISLSYERYFYEQCRNCLQDCEISFLVKLKIRLESNMKEWSLKYFFANCQLEIRFLFLWMIFNEQFYNRIDKSKRSKIKFC